MRASAILIGVLALFITSCTLEPQEKIDAKKELAKLKGPDTGSINGALYTQAQQASSAGDYKRAAQIYRQLVDKSPDRMDYQIALAENLRRAGDGNTSLHVIDKVLAKEPNNTEAMEAKGLALMSTGEFDEAGDELGKVVKLDSKRWRTLNAIGILFAMKGKYDDAVAYFQAALNVSTDNPSVLNNAALTYAIDKQFGRAYEAFDKAKRHLDAGSPELKHLDLNLALVYAVDGKLDEAEQTASPHLSKAALYNNMGFYSYLSKNNEMAKGYLNMALTQSPTYYERAWKNLGALTGESSSMSGEGQAMPAGMNAPLPLSQQGTVPLPANASSVVAIPLNDIPESKPLHSDANSPYAGAEQKADVPKVNPDVVLHKSADAQHNADWDSKDTQGGGAPAVTQPVAGGQNN